MTSPQTFPLGDRTVQRVGFGAMQLPGAGVFGPPRDREAAIAVLERVREAGVDHIDTAQFYGPDVANELIREVLHPYPAEMTLVSKVGARRDDRGAWLPAQRPEELRAGVEDNLRSLAVERVDVVNLRIHDGAHGDGPGAVDFEDQLAEMVAMREKGSIGAVGLSNVSIEQLDHALEVTGIACVQNAFNLADRSSAQVLKRCEERGIAFVPFFPLGSAFASDRPVLGHPAVVAAAGRLGVTPSQVALAWLLAHSPNILLIPGTSSVAHLESNLAAGRVTLDEEAFAAIG
jgi:pyridoxine 4-dehydrogenase